MPDETLAPLQIRRDSEIFDIDGGWYRARWHFSFDQYHDAANMNVGQLRVFNHDTLRPGAIWPMHPHRDVEGITYVVAGEFEHADSLGHGGVLYPGGVQRMTLGRGADHSERNHSQTEEMQFIQMWIIPDRGASIRQSSRSNGPRPIVTTACCRSSSRRASTATRVMVHQDASMYVSRLDAGAAVEHTFSEGRGGYFYLIDGEADVNGEQLATGDAAKIVGAGALRITASAVSELIIVDTPL